MNQKTKSDNKDRENRDDKTPSDIKPEYREELLKDIRGVIREELDQDDKEKKNDKEKKTKKGRFSDEVRSILKEEIDEAIRIKQSKYLRKYTVELGVLVSYQPKGADSDENDEGNLLRVFPQFAFFIDNNVALALRGETEFDLTNNTRAYSGVAGPEFIFGITKKDDVCFYVDIMAGVSRNSRVSNRLGYRYTNGCGLKFLLTRSLNFNAGVQLVFDNLETDRKEFKKDIVPTIGLTAWF